MCALTFTLERCLTPGDGLFSIVSRAHSDLQRWLKTSKIKVSLYHVFDGSMKQCRSAPFSLVDLKKFYSYSVEGTNATPWKMVCSL